MDSKCKPTPTAADSGAEASKKPQAPSSQQTAEQYYAQRRSFAMPRPEQKKVDMYFSQRRSFAVPR